MNTIAIKTQLANILTDESNRFDQNQADAIASLTKFRSGDLESTRYVSSDGISITQSIKGYGRVLDINPKRRASGINAKKRTVHNKFAFGMYHAVAYRAANIYIAGVKSAIVNNFPK